MTTTPRVTRPSTAVLLSALLGTAALGLTACGTGTGDAVPAADDLGAVTVPATPSEAPTTTDDPTTGDPTTTTTNDDPATSTTGGTSGDDHLALPGGARTAVLDTRAKLDIDDQSGDGRQVRIREIRLTAHDGFVVIVEAGGAVLGSAPVSAASAPVSVPLGSPLGSSQTLLGVLYADDGDGRFDPAADRPVAEERDSHGELELADEDFHYRVAG